MAASKKPLAAENVLQGSCNQPVKLASQELTSCRVDEQLRPHCLTSSPTPPASEQSEGKNWIQDGSKVPKAAVNSEVLEECKCPLLQYAQICSTIVRLVNLGRSAA